MLKLAAGYEVDIFSFSRFLLIPHMHCEIIAEAFFQFIVSAHKLTVEVCQ